MPRLSPDTETLVLSRLSSGPQTAHEIAQQIHFSRQTVYRILRRALGNGRVVRDALPEGKRWVYGWRLRCQSCGK